MSDTEKKLDALIEALGFDVEVIDNSFDLHHPTEYHDDGQQKLGGGRFDRTIKVIDYKLTKRTKGGIKCTQCGTHLGCDSPLDSCLCKSPANLVRF